MALGVVRTPFLLSSVSASKFAITSGDAHCKLSNGAGISAFGGELTISGRIRRAVVGSSRSESWGSTGLLRSRNGNSRRWKLMHSSVSVRAVQENEIVETSLSLESEESASNEAMEAVPAKGLPNQVLEAKGLAYDGPGKGGQWLSSTTRHVRIYIGVADPETKLMDQTQLDKITLMLDPDNEFIWPEDKVQKVYNYFAELVEGYAGAPCTEYTLRLIGSDIEHYIRKLLLGNEIKYNLDCRVLNFSMGKPRYESGIVEEAED
ncbi:unnamed protein product [Calypogeia fissa]